jgi:transcriptional regulator with XRE-family HTH domain
MTLIRVTGSQLHAARVLVGLSREDLAERAGLCRHSIRKWETSSDTVPAATYSHLCRAVDVLENEGARFSSDGVSALSGDSPDYLMEAVPPSINSNDSKGLHLTARVRHARRPHASMSRSANLRGSYSSAPRDSRVMSTSNASQHADR